MRRRAFSFFTEEVQQVTACRIATKEALIKSIDEEEVEGAKKRPQERSHVEVK